MTISISPPSKKRTRTRYDAGIIMAMALTRLIGVLALSISDEYGDSGRESDVINIFLTDSHISEVILTPIRENIAHRHHSDYFNGEDADGTEQLRGSTSSLMEAQEQLTYSSNSYPFYIESFVTFDSTLIGEESLSSAKLQLFSLSGSAVAVAFGISMKAVGYDMGYLEWDVDYSNSNVSCRDSKTCRMEIDVTDGIMWNMEQLEYVEDRLPLSSTLTVRISVQDLRPGVQGAFASSKYYGGMFSPKLVLDFDEEGLGDYAMTRRGDVKDKKHEEKKKENNSGNKKPSSDKDSKEKNKPEEKEHDEKKHGNKNPGKKRPRPDKDKNKPEEKEQHEKKHGNNKPGKKKDKDSSEKNKPEEKEQNDKKPGNKKPGKKKDKDSNEKNKPEEKEQNDKKPGNKKPGKKKDKDSKDKNKPEEKEQNDEKPGNKKPGKKNPKPHSKPEQPRPEEPKPSNNNGSKPKPDNNPAPSQSRPEKPQSPDNNDSKPKPNNNPNTPQQQPSGNNASTPKPNGDPKPSQSKPGKPRPPNDISTPKPIAETNPPSTQPSNPYLTTLQPTPGSTPRPTGTSFVSSSTVVSRTLGVLDSKKNVIMETILIYQDPVLGQIDSVYSYDGLAKGLKLMGTTGVSGNTFYLGNDNTNGHLYGLANIAAFLAQSMKETIMYNACDENNWDLINQKYPLSNACGQLGQSYQDYHCSPEEAHMECSVDPQMEITAVTHATWYGAPGPFYCKPKTSSNDFTGFWDYSYSCNNPWATPPETCDVYEGQRAGRYDNSIPVANNAGRTDVEGCCWWGRGVIQTSGVCNFGKLNYYLGARAAKEGRIAPYPSIDFCKDPEAICSSQDHKELKWIAGMFYWMESVENYDAEGWNYMEQLHAFVDGGSTDSGFINSVSGIVNRGCHNPPCGTGELDGGAERAGYFGTVMGILNGR